MPRSFSRLTRAALVIATLAVAAGAAAQERTQQRDQVKARVQERAGQREIIPGSELMTPREREAYLRQGQDPRRAQEGDGTLERPDESQVLATGDRGSRRVSQRELLQASSMSRQPRAPLARKEPS